VFDGVFLQTHKGKSKICGMNDLIFGLKLRMLLSKQNNSGNPEQQHPFHGTNTYLNNSIFQRTIHPCSKIRFM
jgi:hypothetical protein